MALIIGYVVVLCITFLDFYFRMNASKEKKVFIYTPFDYLSGHDGDFYEKEPAQKKA